MEGKYVRNSCFINYSRVNIFREPIFAISSELRDYENYSKEVYKGFGYRIEIDKVENQKIISNIPMTMEDWEKRLNGFLK